MKPRYRLSRDAVELIERFEGFRRKAAKLPNGGWTIGFGHTRTAREGAEVTREDAEALLLYDLIGVSHAVNEKIFTPLTQNQFDALTAFAFSIGVENFETSAVLRRVNEGQMLAAAYAMEMWRRAPVGGEMIVVDALVRRRAAEKALFLTPPDGLVPSPSPVLPPNLDYELLTAAPREMPVVVDTPLDGDQASAERVEPVAPPAPPPTAAEDAVVALGAQLEGLLPDEAAAAAVEPEMAPQSHPETTPEETAGEIAPETPPQEASASPDAAATDDAGFSFEQETVLIEPVAEADSSSDDVAHFEEVEAPSEPAGEEPPAADDEPVAAAPVMTQHFSPGRDVVPSGWGLDTEAERDPFQLSPPTEVQEPAPVADAPELPEADQPQLAFTGSMAASNPLAADLRTFRDEEATDFRLAGDEWISASMLLLGLLMFGGGTVWAVLRTSTSGALVNSTTIGWGVGLIGLVLACVGFYRILQRFQDAGEDASNSR